MIPLRLMGTVVVVVVSMDLLSWGLGVVLLDSMFLRRRSRSWTLLPETGRFLFLHSALRPFTGKKEHMV